MSISLEMHCSPPQQQKCAALLRRHLGDALLVRDSHDLTEAMASSFAPEGLRHRVILKGKIAPLVGDEASIRRSKGWRRRCSSL